MPVGNFFDPLPLAVTTDFDPLLGSIGLLFLRDWASKFNFTDEVDNKLQEILARKISGFQRAYFTTCMSKENIWLRLGDQCHVGVIACFTYNYATGWEAQSLVFNSIGEKINVEWRTTTMGQDFMVILYII